MKPAKNHRSGIWGIPVLQAFAPPAEPPTASNHDVKTSDQILEAGIETLPAEVMPVRIHRAGYRRWRFCRGGGRAPGCEPIRGRLVADSSPPPLTVLRRRRSRPKF